MLLLKNNGTNGNNLNLNNNGMLHNHNGMHHNLNNGLHNHNNGLLNHNNGTLLLNHNGMHQLHKHQAVVTNTQQEFLHNHAQIIHTVMFLQPQDLLDHHVLHHLKDLLKDYIQLEFQHNLVQTTQNANS